ncbi:aldolase/citrate lyase family protein [Halomonas getboli]|uniref:aldolase/citrate lyase family protein n=1 Tax=Halomonas getboli TaxID=2935862 RepID=UPI001FFFD8A1|nr:aldolase/citrate lyase family protein [Halomonas getboli]MCK2183060.1 HpcH/HpaI aldolase/citrate lyase family protein [Halomonas getboli]
MSGLKCMMITACPEVARLAEDCGVARIFMDQEVLGKAQRQAGLDAHQACHSLAEVAAMAAHLRRAELMVRLNPLNPRSPQEVESALECGAGRLMLPMFTRTEEVRQFQSLVRGRVPVTYLAETPAALVRLGHWLPLLRPGIDEVHVGLNDLSLGLGVGFLFEPLAGGVIDGVARELATAGVEWGFGGVGCLKGSVLPADWILGEHVRLGSRWVILSRAFHGGAGSLDDLRRRVDLAVEVRALRIAEGRWRRAGAERLEANHRRLAARVFEIAEPPASPAGQLDLSL